MAYDARITNSEGAEFSNQFGRVIYASSHGFAGEYRGSTFGHSVAPVASQNGAMQRDYWYSSNRRFAKLESPKSVGEKAAQRVLRRLGGRKVKTCEVPIVFDPEMAASLLRNLASALSGYSLVQGRIVFGRQTRHANRLRAADGDRRRHDSRRARLATVRRRRIADAKKNRRRKRASCKAICSIPTAAKNSAWLPPATLLGRSAKRPGVSPANFYLASGKDSPEQIIKSVKAGLYVTEMIGFGVNMVTGDYSRGAAGLWIENGEFDLSGRRDHHRRQSQRDVAKHRNGRQRSRDARPDCLADDQNFPDDRGRRLKIHEDRRSRIEDQVSILHSRSSILAAESLEHLKSCLQRRA